jgi:tryptophan synthase alpha chain
MLLAHQPNYVYVMANPQTTGQAFHQHPALHQFLTELRSLTSATLCVGFGIQTASDVAALRGHADVAVVGSALLRAHAENRLREVLEDLVGAAPVLA